MSATLPQASADLIINGDFETGDFTGWTTGANSFPETIVFSPVHGGTHAAQIAGFSSNPNTLSQTVSTISGQTYDLSFWRDVTNGGATNFLTLSWDGHQFFSELNVGDSNGYQQFSVNVVGNGSDTLLFTCANDPAFTYLDDVSLTSVSAVPEPSSTALLVSGGICMVVGAIRRRVRNTAV
jgi:hypothetical protein